MEEEECLSCELYLHLTENKVPEGCELSWHLHEQLSGSAVKLYRLEDLIWETLELGEMEPHEVAEMVTQLNAIVDGIGDATNEITKPKKK